MIIHDFPSWIGTDESGKGDYFGSLVVAGVMVDETNKEDVNKMVLTFIDDIVKKKYRANDNIPDNIALMLESPDSSDDDAAPIAWPIYPIENITHYFNDANFEKAN